MILDKNEPRPPTTFTGWLELATQAAVLETDDGTAGVICALIAIAKLLKNIDDDLDIIKAQGGR